MAKRLGNLSANQESVKKSFKNQNCCTKTLKKSFRQSGVNNIRSSQSELVYQNVKETFPPIRSQLIRGIWFGKNISWCHLSRNEKVYINCPLPKYVKFLFLMCLLTPHMIGCGDPIYQWKPFADWFALLYSNKHYTLKKNNFFFFLKNAKKDLPNAPWCFK